MKSSTTPVFHILHFLSWIVFTGISIKTGAIITSFIGTVFFNVEASKILYLKFDIASLYGFSKTWYLSLVVTLIVIGILKAFMMYQVITIFFKMDLKQPFNEEISKLISKISYLALVIGLVAMVAEGFAKWLTKKGVGYANLQDYLGSAGEFLMLGGIIFIIAQIFKKGIELQTENDLTV